MSFDLTKPHQYLVGGPRPLVIQNGLVYDHGTKKALGPIAQHESLLRIQNKDAKFCSFCGGTFPLAESFEKHVLAVHRDILVSRASKKAPKNIEGEWSPSEEMLKKEARDISEAKPEEKKEEEPSGEIEPERKNHKKILAPPAPKGWRQPA